MTDPHLQEVVLRVYATQSTHKSLTAFRQGAMIHIFDQALFLTHTTLIRYFLVLVPIFIHVLAAASCPLTSLNPTFTSHAYLGLYLYPWPHYRRVCPLQQPSFSFSRTPRPLLLLHPRSSKEARTLHSKKHFTRTQAPHPTTKSWRRWLWGDHRCNWRSRAPALVHENECLRGAMYPRKNA